MANGDSLRDLIELARRELPDVPAEVWERFEVLASLRYATARLYVPARKKRRHLEALAAADADMDVEKLACLLGLSVRRVQQLKKLK